MYARILVPLDGSRLAEQVLPYVRAIGKMARAPITLLRVFNPAPLGMVDAEHGLYVDNISATVRDDTEAYLRGIRASLSSLGVYVAVESCDGDPAGRIITEAAKVPDTLIAMATHGRSGISRWLLGSVTDKVLHFTTSPLMIVRASGDVAASPAGGDAGTVTGEVMLKNIIVPVDGSPLAEQVLPHVIHLARGMGLEVTLVRVIPHFDGFGGTLGYPSTEEPAPFHMGVRSEMYDAMIKEEEARARDYLLGLKDRLYREGVTTISELVFWGSAEEAILDLAKGTAHTMVAMTTHGRSGMGRWVLGSVTDRVVRHSGDPVLVIRGVAVESEAAQDAPKEEVTVN